MKFPNLPAAAALDGTEIVPATQSGGDVKTTAQAIADLFDGTEGVDVASGTTTNIGAAGGVCVKVTGTTTITAFDTADVGVLRFVNFAGALTLTHNATALFLPTGANITTAANDCAIFKSGGSGNWRCLMYQRATGQALASFSSGMPEVWEYALSDETTSVTTGTKLVSRARRAFALTDVRLSCTTASGSGAVTVDIKKNGTSIFTTKISMDASEKTSVTAATPYVLTGAITFADDDEIAFSIDGAGSACAGVKAALIGTV